MSRFFKRRHQIAILAKPRGAQAWAGAGIKSVDVVCPNKEPGDTVVTGAPGAWIGNNLDQGSVYVHSLATVTGTGSGRIMARWHQCQAMIGT